MSLADGGHLTHGASVNFSGKMYHAAIWLEQATGEVDYDQVEALALEHKPKMIIAGFFGLFAGDGLVLFSRHRRQGRRLSDGRYGPRGRPGGRRCLPQPRPLADGW